MAGNDQLKEKVPAKGRHRVLDKLSYVGFRKNSKFSPNKIPILIDSCGLYLSHLKARRIE